MASDCFKHHEEAQVQYPVPIPLPTFFETYFIIGELSPLQEVPAGNVLAIAGLDNDILKSATLTSSPAARPLAPMLFQVCLGCVWGFSILNPDDL